MNLDAEESLRFFATLAMTKGERLAMTIRIAKRLELPLFLLQSLFPGKCPCALTFLISFSEQLDHATQAHKENASANRRTPG